MPHVSAVRLDAKIGSQRNPMAARPRLDRLQNLLSLFRTTHPDSWHVFASNKEKVGHDLRKTGSNWVEVATTLKIGRRLASSFIPIERKPAVRGARGKRCSQMGASYGCLCPFGCGRYVSDTPLHQGGAADVGTPLAVWELVHIPT